MSTSYVLSPAELAEWNHRSRRDRPDDDPEGDPLRDPIWRLCNLYQIMNAKGKAVHFVPTPEQRVVIWVIHKLGWLSLIIPKARQLGISTVLLLMALDLQVFEKGFAGALIDKKGDDCSKKMREKYHFSWGQLPEHIRNEFNVVRSNDGELTVELKPLPGQKEKPVQSIFQADIGFRGGTVRWLHVSEWGWIQNNDRQRSREIQTGAIPAAEKADNGIKIIETTWQGGLDGEMGPYVNEALDTPEHQKGPKSWRILFFPWFTEPTYRQPHGYIDPVSAAYFREIAPKILADHGAVLTPEQMLWYAEKRRTAVSAKTMKEEYPSLCSECWENVPVGSIYGKWIDEARVEGRISNFTAPRDYPVHTFWDLGHSMNTVDILIQITPNQIRIVDALMEVDMTVEQRGEWHKQLGWNYGNHYLPWDADTDNASIGIKPIDHYRRVFGPTCRVVPQCRTKWDGIGIVRANFNRFVFCADALAKDTSTPGGRVKQLIEHLGRYRAERETSTGIAKDEPVHDRYSHAADALRQLGQAMWSGLVENANTVGGRPQLFADVGRRIRVVGAGSTY